MNEKDLRSAKRQELLRIAAGLGIRGRSKMKNAQLVDAILKAGEPGRPGEPGGTDEYGESGGSRRASAGGGKAAAGKRKTQKREGPIREGILVRRSWREQQAVVQHAKYEIKMAAAPRPAATGAPETVKTEEQELPPAYKEDRIVLLVRDPYWVHVYWDITRESLLKARSTLGDKWHASRSILRVYDITGVDFDGNNANSHYDIEVSGGASNWYINTQVPNRTYCVDIGLLSPTGEFLMLARSNRATTPRDAPPDAANAADEEWMIPDWEFEKIYALSGGFSVGTGSLELKEMMEKALGGEVSSGAPGSFAISSPVGKPRARGFWFRLGTELIVYGATMPDAKVTLQGKPIKLRPDGTFTVRFELPDGKQVIPAVAESADGIDRITITPVVDKKTEK